MRRVGGNHQGVDAKAHALLGVDHLQVRVAVHGQQHKGCEHVTHADLAGDHVVVRGVVVKGADVGPQAHQLFFGLHELLLIGGVEGIAQRLERDAHDVARVVDDDDAVLERRVPQILIAGDLDVHQVGVVDNQRGACGVGHGVLVVLIVILA